ncbi:MAG: hypothetical protein ACREIF_09435 [Chthoniobacterales bacterium]
MRTSNLCVLILAAALASALFGRAVEAAPISGDITFAGRIQLDTGDVNTATAVTAWFNTHVEVGDGDFGSIAPNTPATFAAPWTFNPSTPTPGLWSVDTFTFDLLTATIVSQGGGFLNISGTGTVSSTTPGLDPTPGTWFFSTQDPKTAGTFSFSAGDTSVPEASTTAALFAGAGLLLTVQRIRRRQV